MSKRGEERVLGHEERGSVEGATFLGRILWELDWTVGGSDVSCGVLLTGEPVNVETDCKTEGDG